MGVSPSRIQILILTLVMSIQVIPSRTAVKAFEPVGAGIQSSLLRTSVPMYFFAMRDESKGEVNRGSLITIFTIASVCGCDLTYSLNLCVTCSSGCVNAVSTKIYSHMAASCGADLHEEIRTQMSGTAVTFCPSMEGLPSTWEGCYGVLERAAWIVTSGPCYK